MISASTTSPRLVALARFAISDYTGCSSKSRNDGNGSRHRMWMVALVGKQRRAAALKGVDAVSQTEPHFHAVDNCRIVLTGQPSTLPLAVSVTPKIDPEGFSNLLRLAARPT